MRGPQHWPKIRCTGTANTARSTIAFRTCSRATAVFAIENPRYRGRRATGATALISPSSVVMRPTDD